MVGGVNLRRSYFLLESEKAILASRTDPRFSEILDYRLLPARLGQPIFPRKWSDLWGREFLPFGLRNCRVRLEWHCR